MVKEKVRCSVCGKFAKEMYCEGRDCESFSEGCPKEKYEYFYGAVVIFCRECGYECR